MKISHVKLIIFRAGLTEGGKLEKNNSYGKKTVGMKTKLNTTLTILFLVKNFSLEKIICNSIQPCQAKLQ